MPKLTLLELQERAGKPQLTFVHVATAEQAAAAEEAGIDMIGTAFLPETRFIPSAAKNTTFRFGLKYGQYFSAEMCIRTAFSAIECGADIIYSAQSLEFVEAMAKQGIAVCGHVGLVPPLASWTGGLCAVGKTADQAVDVLQKVKNLESAGAFAVELEVIPDRVATEIAKRTNLLTISMGAGAGCDVQYLFSNDILGETDDRIPRHAKSYRNLKAEQERLQRERVAGYKEFVDDVRSGSFPAESNLVSIHDDEFEKALDGFERLSRREPPFS